MVTRKIVIRPGNLLALSKEPFCHGSSRIVALFGQGLPIPQEFIGTGGHPIRYLDDLNSSA
jgi:hypothetical protein